MIADIYLEALEEIIENLQERIADLGESERIIGVVDERITAEEGVRQICIKYERILALKKLYSDLNTLKTLRFW